MSKISSISNKLGEYLLQGYILTDDACPNCSVPMLKTPIHISQSQRIFCSQCSDIPQETGHDMISNTSHLYSSEINVGGPGSSRQTTAELLGPSRSSPSQLLNDATVMSRRAQSDKASIEIGHRMLKGWAMLADECMNESCYGIPLVRPPRSGAEKDMKMECVICGGVYVHKKSADGQIILTKQNPAPATSTTPSGNAMIQFTPTKEDGKVTPLSSQHTSGGILKGSSAAEVHASAHVDASYSTTLSATISSLEHSLQVLSTRLTFVADTPPLDHRRIGEIAQSIEQVSSALKAVKALHI